MSTTDVDSAAKTTVETTVARVEHKVLSSFFETDPVASAGAAGNGAMPVVNDDSSVLRFLSRPIKIRTTSLSIGQVPYLTIAPWVEYLSHPTVKPRISHYARLRADMVLRCNINGSPMHYGMFRVCYRPHPGGAVGDDLVFNHAIALEAGSSAINLKLVASQLDGFYVNPCRDSSLELRIPYMHSKPGLELYGLADAYTIGTVYVIGFAPLAHASGGTSPITLEFYAHLENVTLDVPTVVTQGYTLQDAAHVVRRVLSATAKATTIAEEWSPRILSAIAMLGFSRPLTLEAPSTVREIPFNLSNYDAPDTSVPLSLSESAETPLGGQELGASGDDELVLSRLAARRAFICSSQWGSSLQSGSFLMGSVVTPVQTSVSSYTKSATPNVPSYSPVTHTCLTPAAFAAITCKYWRGTVCYRFTVAASPYHKGRLRIYYDPFPGGWAFDPNPSMNITNSIVLDLAETDSIDVEVPWQNVRDMAECQSPFVQATTNDNMLWGSMCSAAETTHCNGFIVCSVLSPLTSIQSDTPVTLLVEMWVKDLVLFSPRIARGDNGAPLCMDGEAIPYAPESFDVTGGDAVASLRQLVKRYVVEHEVFVPNTLLSAAVSSAYVSYDTFARLPVPGPVSNWHEAVDATAYSEPVNYTGLSFYTYVSTAFALARGAVRWKVAAACRNSGGYCSAPIGLSRFTDPLGDIVSRRNAVVATSLASSAPSSMSTRARTGAHWRCGDQGLLLTGELAGPGANGYLDVQLPYCSSLRAYAPRCRRFGGAFDRECDNVRLTMELSGSLAGNNLSSFALFEVATAAGEDFNVYGFIHAPAFLSSIPVIAP